MIHLFSFDSCEHDEFVQFRFSVNRAAGDLEKSVFIGDPFDFAANDLIFNDGEQSPGFIPFVPAIGQDEGRVGGFVQFD